MLSVLVVEAVVVGTISGVFGTYLEDELSAKDEGLINGSMVYITYIF
jgi:hypothetical protein